MDIIWIIFFFFLEFCTYTVGINYVVLYDYKKCPEESAIAVFKKNNFKNVLSCGPKVIVRFNESRTYVRRRERLNGDIVVAPTMRFKFVSHQIEPGKYYKIIIIQIIGI